MTARLCISLALAATALMAQSGYPPNIPGATRVETYKSVDGVELKLWIFEPTGHKASDSRPAIVFYFGGGWNGGSPEQFVEHSKYLASRGMVAMTADYRVRSRHGVTADKCVQDAFAALRWVRTNAKRLGVDPGRIAAGGGSAGGHLAAAIATLPGHDDPAGDKKVSARPNALALYNPATVLAPAPGFEAFEARRAELAERMGAPVETMSPYHHVAKGTPPTVIFHGKADTTVPYATAEGFCRKMREAGNSCVLHGYEGAAHGFFNFSRPDKAPFRSTLRQTDEFFASLGWLKGEPTLGATE
jgi:acetyl esterase